MAEILKNINIQDIVANPYQPRLYFDSLELQELAESIKINGLIQPIIVRKSDIFGYELIAGERRLKASQLAGLKQIPAIIKDISNDESMHQAIIENLQRSDLNPIEEAKAFQAIIDKNKLTHEQLATFMGKSRPYITNSLRLLHLPDTILKAIEENTISSGHARALLALTNQQKQKKYFNEIIKNNLSVRQTELLIKKQDTQPKKKKATHDTIFIRAIETELNKSLGIKVNLGIKKDGSGTLVCSFQNEEELNRIINKLN
ncbi:ParB/RepB/Spo0J family partition protein [Streptococcus didelphis]|uniref:ParB/RepB/Spo0J family partition protein n=1 Tax=Streptococcus didelphis TaxID=102886 RepID=A0ABY9LFG7_9STRE|nr:ParB/RepB/Spo0J family partition protein [Streptococcus didelphis]WMB27629.1 ParB/RepB/Spo0J family partition protein [Streptococcus didelphis]